MTIAEMFGQSGILAVFGMGTVFLFLVILIVCMKASSFLIRKFGKVEEVSAERPAFARASNSDEEVAAASAAIQHHNKSDN